MRIVWINKHTFAIYYIRDLSRQTRDSTCSINVNLRTSSNNWLTILTNLIGNPQYYQMCTGENMKHNLLEINSMNMNDQ